MTNYVLKYVNNYLELHAPAEKNFTPFYIDFVAGKLRHRRIFPGKELLAKAVGFKKTQALRVIDATAGLGRDAFVLASLGCEVTLIERSPLLFALLEDGLRRAAADVAIAEIVGRMTLVSGDAKALFNQLSADVIYLDPMYPERTKSALVKKEMQILHDIIGADADSDQLLPAALASGVKRVVVKRPKYAENLAGMEPNFSYNGKNTRFDIYVK